CRCGHSSAGSCNDSSRHGRGAASAMRRGGYRSDVTYYCVSAGLDGVSLVEPVLIAARLRRALRQFSTLRSATQAVLDSELGLLRARRAALAVAARRRFEEPEGH